MEVLHSMAGLGFIPYFFDELQCLVEGWPMVPSRPLFNFLDFGIIPNLDIVIQDLHHVPEGQRPFLAQPKAIIGIRF